MWKDFFAPHLKGLAICKNTSFELCPNFAVNDWNTFLVAKDLYGNTTIENEYLDVSNNNVNVELAGI